MDPLSLGVGAIGMFSQKDANNAMEEQAQQQYALQKQMIDAQLAGYGDVKNQVQANISNGVYDPTKAIALAQAQATQGLNNSLQNVIGGGASAGNRIGDSVLNDAASTNIGNYKLGLQQQVLNTGQQYAQNELSALQSAVPVGLGTAIDSTGENARFDVGREQSLSGMLGALAPYIGNKPPSAGAGAKAPSAGAAVGGGLSGVGQAIPNGATGAGNVAGNNVVTVPQSGAGPSFTAPPVGAPPSVSASLGTGGLGGMGTFSQQRGSSSPVNPFRMPKAVFNL